MKRKRFSEEQIIGILNEAEQTGNIREVCRLHNISEQTFYRWRTKFGGMDVSEARRLKELERENAELKKMVADLSLHNRLLKELNAKKMVSLADRRQAAEHLESMLGVSERRACRVVEIARSTKRRPSGRIEEARLFRRVHELTERYPRFGYREIHAVL